MRLRYACAVLAVNALLGCQDTTTNTAIQQLKSENLELRRSLMELTMRFDQLATNVTSQGNERRTAADQAASLESKWNRFQAAYEPATRDTFEQNAKAATQLLEKLKSSQEASDKTLASLVQTAEECQRLKDLCSQHAKEANDANLVGQLKESVMKLDQSVNGLSEIRSNVRSVQSDVSSLNSKVRSLESKVSSVESNVRSLHSKVRW
jgi:chromosome segregation ATPase